MNHGIRLFIVLGLLSSTLSSQHKSTLGDNAALRYYAAFSVMQDSTVSDTEARKLIGILDGTAPYDDLQYKILVKENLPALELMTLGASHDDCDWGLEYQLRDQVPVEYARKALQLGRLNVLYAFHLSITGDKDGAVRTLAAGMRFSRDVANGGSLFAALVAKQLLVEHLRAGEGLLHIAGLSQAQRAVLRGAVEQISSRNIDWQTAIQRELTTIGKPYQQGALRTIAREYSAALKDPSLLGELEASTSKLAPDLQALIPNPKRVIEEKQDFESRIQQARKAMQ